MLTPDQAEKLILGALPLFPAERCSLAAAHGRVLRTDLRADRDLPPFDRVTMDGYAVRAAALKAGRREFRIEGTQAAGMRPFKLGAADAACVEVMTGAVLPGGADCIVPYEETERQGATMKVLATAAGGPGRAVHRRGSDHGTGEVIVKAGTRITGREIAVAAAIGAAELMVTRVPKIAVVATGDELVEVGDAVAPHQIRRSNDHALRAALGLAGYGHVERFHLHDMPHEIQHMLWHILAEFDVVLITGGVSKGKFDFLPAELDAQGVRQIFHGVAQRPGKPLWFGLNPDQKPVFALPGNPVSAYTCLHRYVLPGLAHASGQTITQRRLAALAAPVTFHPKLAYFIPVKLSSGGHGELLATPDPSNTSGDFSGLVGTDGFLELPANQAVFPAGYVAPYQAWI
ncbi:MAG: molybdopterin molybdotransferase MoeA [Opitutaceae bacterium]